ncbi:MAG: DNA helicase UvrD, partial [Candidatus Blackburnbacteria bacterium]|nr:DNA helicase UvrD [Candidatus Blackburnbacteria bacterium]
MQIIADLQLHSKYSRAVSKDMVVSEIARWAGIKGIDLVTTGDWTHPLWFRELQASLEEAG